MFSVHQLAAAKFSLRCTATSTTPALPTAGSPQLWFGAAKLSPTPGALALDQGFQTLSNERRSFAQATDALRFRQQLIFYIQGGSHRSLAISMIKQAPVDDK
jgi:hypothetical protein